MTDLKNPLALLQLLVSMQACSRCGHDNADHLKFCFSCGRRLTRKGESTLGVSEHRSGVGDGRVGGSTNFGTGFAPTLALSPVRIDAEDGTSGSQAPSHPVPVWARSWDAVRYVFVYIRGRMDAEDRKRTLLDERDGAQRLIEAALFDLGQNVLAESSIAAPGLVALIEAFGKARARREHAIADLAAADNLQAADDLRLGIEQSNAETEWKACEARAQELDKVLLDLENEGRAIEDNLRDLQNREPGGDIAARTLEVASLDKKRALAHEQYGHLRERAAALRATTLAARAKFDQASAMRRQSASALAASLSAHARDRTEAEQQIRQLTLQLGRTAMEVRLPRPTLLRGYAHIARLESTVAERDRQVAGLEEVMGRYDLKRLVLGVGLLLGTAAIVGAGLWLISR